MSVASSQLDIWEITSETAKVSLDGFFRPLRDLSRSGANQDAEILEVPTEFLFAIGCTAIIFAISFQRHSRLTPILLVATCGIFSAFLLIREAWKSARRALAKICLYAAGLLLLYEVAYFLQLALHEQLVLTLHWNRTVGEASMYAFCGVLAGILIFWEGWKNAARPVSKICMYAAGILLLYEVFFFLQSSLNKGALR
jgi:hypothetical protein